MKKLTDEEVRKSFKIHHLSDTCKRRRSHEVRVGLGDQAEGLVAAREQLGSY